MPKGMGYGKGLKNKGAKGGKTGTAKKTGGKGKGGSKTAPNTAG